MSFLLNTYYTWPQLEIAVIAKIAGYNVELIFFFYFSLDGPVMIDLHQNVSLKE